MENIAELKTFLSIPKDIVICSHRNPDGDAIGSSLGLYHFLNKMGHTVRVVFPSEYPDFVAWLPDAESVIIYDIESDRAEEVVDRADLIFCLDFNSLSRIDRLGEYIGGKGTPLAMIDHHLYPDLNALYEISDPSSSSTCELVYDFIQMMEMQKELDVPIGECLFTGILTDTGSFKYATSPKLFRIVAHLIEIGVDDYKIQDLIFNAQSEKRLRLLGHCLANRMEILPEFHTGIIYLTRNDYDVFNIQRGDTEGIVNMMLTMKNIKVAAFIMEQPTIVKLSLRSKGDFSVQEICQKHFKGGGHKNASGGASYFSLKKTIQKLKDILPEYKTALDDAKPY